VLKLGRSGQGDALTSRAKHLAGPTLAKRRTADNGDETVFVTGGDLAVL